MGKIKRKIISIRKLINYWNYLYYVKNKPIVSDYEYDQAVKELILLENYRPDLITSESPTQKINVNIKNFHNSIHHISPMLSFDSIYKYNDLINFDNKIRNIFKVDRIVYCCEPKIDGVAVSILYENGKLKYAVTRGNGYIGENITNNILNISSIPLSIENNITKIPSLLEIRGEVFLIRNNKSNLLNERNNVAGALRKSNLDVSDKKLLGFYCYSADIISKELFFDYHYNLLQYLKLYKIPINKYISCFTNTKDIIKFYHDMHKKKALLNFNTDGIVIKINSFAMQKKLGVTNKIHKWAIAYKFPSHEKITTVKNIVYQVGRTGVITPVAKLSMINIAGANITSASLHNFNEIEKLNIMINDTVIVSRIGDVIPKITKVLLYKRNSNAIKIKIPNKCPVCNSVTKYNSNKTKLICTGKLNCSAQFTELVKHFVSKNAVNIPGLGNKLISKLINNNIISNLIDIFYLKEVDLIKISGINHRLAKKIICEIKQSKKNINLPNFIYSLGINGVGIVTSILLSKFYKNINSLIVSDIKILMRIKGVGLKTAKNIYDFFQDKNNLFIVKTLISKKIGLNLFYK
ncbi:MAG: NAD-dependent DNA ligase LigA [Candidatus Lightella neohaematopini]|nr:NAD-dependent DNA ligase LigA [Candidatus Lightella neohaematopini]